MPRGMDELVFRTFQDFRQLTFDHETDAWRFVFQTDYVNSSGMWRVLKDGRIKWVSSDNGQQFGLATQIDLAAEVNELLKGRKLESIIVRKDTADLRLILTGSFEIEIFISSSGYETYEFSFNSKLYVGLGAGDIATF